MNAEEVLSRITANQTADAQAMADLFFEKLTDEVEGDLTLATYLAEIVIKAKGFSQGTRKTAEALIVYGDLGHKIASLAYSQSTPPDLSRDDESEGVNFEF